MNFFVIGLPRSRTAWMANFLTQDKFCYHEGLNGCHSLVEYRKKLGEQNGDSSTGLMLLEMNQLFPDEPKLVIRSNTKRAIDFAYETYGFYDPDYFLFLESRLEQIKGWHISLEDIDSNLENIWDYLIGTEFNKQRADLLTKLRIEIKDPFDFDQQAMKSFMANEVPFVGKEAWNTIN